MNRESDDLRRRLRRLSAQPKTPSRSSGPVSAGTPLSQGEWVESPVGQAYRIVETLPQHQLHGQHPLSNLLRFPPDFTHRFDPDMFSETIPWERLVFLDTETTGLAGGAGTIAFLVGVGSFQGDEFVLQQYFLRDPGEEAAMLTVLQRELEAAGAFVTYNGRAFDLPLLEMRYLLSLRTRIDLAAQPHLDLLFLARRLWRRVLPDCRLNTVETNILGVQRSEVDVPGEWIPGMYLDYLRSGDASEMNRVIYHNAVDILSLVGLTAQIFERFDRQDPDALSGAEALAVARWHYQAGREQAAEHVFQAALDANNPLEVRLEAIRQLNLQLKRQDRREELISWWELWHELAPGEITPCVELAMYYEWRARDYQLASTWAQAALVCLSHEPDSWKRKRDWKAIEHRLKRLAGKLEDSPSRD